ncbi:AAA family ATPase [Bacteroides caecigallinarum]|nr:AAA family ATPase [Bacteroides caecigallinarum]
MAILPSKIEQRSELDCRLGIKSSLNHISSVVALSYLLYCANDKSNEIVYADEVNLSNGRKKLVLKDYYKQWIMDNYTVDENSLDNNPLLTSQLEALQVGLGLMFHLAKISFVDFPTTDTKERTGGDRFRKNMKFALNMKLLDLYLMAWPNDLMKTEIILWLNNSPSDTSISEGLKQILTAFSEDTQYKIRANGEEIIFQQIGIYNNISNEDGVIAKDEQEDVGPFRIFKSFVREGLHPFLYLENNEFRCNKSEELDVYDKIVETTLNLSPKKTVIYQEVLDDLKLNNSEPDNTHQIIYYGAPGTGKSHKIKEQLEGVSKENIFRTTFHPDSDYSTFVGAYKPTRSQRPLYGLFGKETVRLKDGEDLSEDIITYKFIPQAFLNAYMQAYKKTNENVYLIIEEINRGNCAQIFGDLFQLLDRDEYGVSEYTIKADADLKAFLVDEMGKDSDAIKDGELCLPSNLYIYATMNTSDQSLFPIDSAFKRRWDWEYEPIKYKNTNWVIDIQGETYSWVSFQKEINRRIFESTSSEDKMLGDYFVNPSNGIITEKMLLNKILFYLWNDVCKDGEGDIFKVSDTEDVSFSELYGDGGKQKLVGMMNYLGVELVQEDIDDDNENDDENEAEDSDKIDNTRYSINGEVTDENDKAWRKGALVKRAVEIYCQNNSELSANEVRDNWINVGFKIPHIVETDEDRERRINTSKDDRAKERSKEIKLPNGESLHVSTQVGDGKKRKGFTDFLSKIKSKPEWGIDIQEL